MPPKKKEEPIPEPVKVEGLSQSELRQMVSNTEEGEEICVEIMQEVREAAADLMVSNYFDRTAVPYTIQSLSADILHLVQFVFVGRDAGEKEDYHEWTPEAEPESVAPDTWARGSVPTRRRAAEPPPPVDPSKAPGSRQSFRKPTRTLSMGSRTASMSRSPDRRQSLGLSARSPSQATSPQTQDSPTKPTSPPGKGAVSPKPPKIKLKTSKEESFSKVAPLSARPMETARSARTMDGRGNNKDPVVVETEEEKLHRMAEELKKVGKDVFVDSLAGKVVPVRPADPSRLMARTMDLEVSISGEGDGLPVAKPAPTRRSPFGLAQKKKAKKEPKVPPGAWVQTEDGKETLIQDIQPSPGVTLRAGDTTMRAELRLPVDKPSRSDFKKKLDALEAAAQFRGPGSDVSGGSGSPAGSPTLAPFGAPEIAVSPAASQMSGPSPVVDKSFHTQAPPTRPVHPPLQPKSRPLAKASRDRALMYSSTTGLSPTDLRSRSPLQPLIGAPVATLEGGDPVQMGMSHTHPKFPVVAADPMLTQQFLQTVEKFK